MLTWIKKHKILFIVEVLCLALLLPGCFAKEKIIVENTEVAGTGWHKIEDISLQPGVYQVRAREAVLEDEFVRLNMISETATYMALRYNEARVTNQAPEAVCTIYVSDTVKDAFIECAPSGIGDNRVSVELVKLNWGNRIALFYVALGFLALNLLIGLRARILEGRYSKEQLLAGGILTLAVGLAYFPYATDYFSFVGDIQVYLTEIERLSENSLLGIWGGLYLLPAVLLRMVGLPLMTAYKLYLLILLAGAAIMTYFGFKRCTGSVWAAVFGSFVYTTSPYLITTVYVTQALDQIVGMAFLPLVLSGVFCLCAKERGSGEHRGAKVHLVWGAVQSVLGIAWMVLVLHESGLLDIVKCLMTSLYGAATAFLAAWLCGGKSVRLKPAVARAVVLLLFLIAFGTVVYRTNDIALHHSAVRLYDM